MEPSVDRGAGDGNRADHDNPGTLGDVIRRGLGANQPSAKSNAGVHNAIADTVNDGERCQCQ